MDRSHCPWVAAFRPFALFQKQQDMRSAFPCAAMVAACVIAVAIVGCSRPDESAADSPPVALTDTALQARLCAALRRIAPQLAGMPEVGARATCHWRGRGVR